MTPMSFDMVLMCLRVVRVCLKVDIERVWSAQPTLSQEHPLQQDCWVLAPPLWPFFKLPVN